MALIGRTCALIPVKAFDRAKVRLAVALSDADRALLARAMAIHVLAAASPLRTWIVCDDPAVSDWALSAGAEVEWTPGLGLNGAVQAAAERRAEEGWHRLVVAHADLPFAEGLSALAAAGEDEVVLVPDRRGSGTNVISVPTGRGFQFRFGTDSFERHRAEAAERGLAVRVAEIEHLGWDIDVPEDLDTPGHLGPLPASLGAIPR